MPFLDPQFATRRRLHVGLIVAGALAGFVFGIVLTRLGKIIAGAPPATLGNYLWNAGLFAFVTAVCSPLISWSFLRRVPLWRTVLEPLLWASAGGAVAVVLGVGPLLLLLPPAGIVYGVLNLRRQYPDSLNLLPGGSRQSGLPGSTDRQLAGPDQARD